MENRQKKVVIPKRRENKQGKCYQHRISQPRESSQATIMGGRSQSLMVSLSWGYRISISGSSRWLQCASKTANVEKAALRESSGNLKSYHFSSPGIITCMWENHQGQRKKTSAKEWAAIPKLIHSWSSLCPLSQSWKTSNIEHWILRILPQFRGQRRPK